MTATTFTALELSALLAIAVSVVTLGGVVVRQVIWQSRTEATAKAARAIAEEAKEDARGAIIRAESADKNLARFREQVAREYTSKDALKALEDRLVAAIERLGDRFDKYVDKG